METEGEQKAKRRRVCSVINEAGLKRYALEYAKQHRAHIFTRVSKEWIYYMMGVVKSAAQRSIHNLPSKGRTIKP